MVLALLLPLSACAADVTQKQVVLTQEQVVQKIKSELIMRKGEIVFAAPLKDIYGRGIDRSAFYHVDANGDDQGDSCFGFIANSANPGFKIKSGGTERLRLDSAGRLLHGTTSSSFNISAVFQGNSDNSASAAGILLQRGTATPPDGQELGNIYFADSAAGTGAIILAKRDGGTWSGSSKPGRLEFHTTADGASSATERMRIHSGGVVSFNNGIELGSGLDATAANTLDDYEEGTWTPSIGGNATYTTQAGNYIKVGAMVLAHFRLGINAKGTGSTVGAISGLPFASSKAFKSSRCKFSINAIAKAS